MSEEKIIVVTDIEDFDEVDVIEVLVSPGDVVAENQSIVTLESDKAMMEFPASLEGTIKEVPVKVGDKVKQGDILVTVVVEDNESESTSNAEINSEKKAAPIDSPSIEEKNKISTASAPENKIEEKIENDKAYASPAVRKYANELGVDLDKVSGSAKQGRIRKEDVQKHVQDSISSKGNSVADKKYKLPDFSKYGEVEEIKLNKLRQVSANHLAHSSSVAPHVTQFDDADISELESVRKKLKQQVAEQGAKLTLLPFVMKALVKCLAEYPDFNSSLNQDITSLIHKKYFNIGIAVDTPRGLVVPVITDVDKKKIPQIAKELLDISALARENKLKPSDMQGGCMTITSIGGIGGQHFTPIINYPEVAILGVSRTQKQLIKNGDAIEERLMLPLSLSYDHRAIDGVAGVKFITSLKNKLSDVWTLMI